MLNAKNISKRLGGKVVLDDVSLEIRPGTITSIIGPSGAGKTTLLRALALLELPDTGVIAVDKEEFVFPSEGLGTKVPWPNVTIVFQSLFIWPHLTLRQNILLPLGGGISREHLRHLDDLIGLFDMSQFIDRYSNEASLGQRQRAAIVRALLLKPKYLLLDEITSSLDIEQVASIVSHLTDVKKQGVGIVLVTHLVHFARAASDAVIFFDEGKIIETGTSDILVDPKSVRLRRFLAMAEAAS